MTAAAVFEHELSDVNIARAVEYRITYRRRTALSALSRNYPRRNVLLGIKAVYHEAIARIYRINAAQIAYYNVALYDRMRVYHFLEKLGLLVVHLDTLLYVGHIENFLRSHSAAADKQLFHELIIAYRKVAEASQSRSGIHEETDEDPALGVKHFVNGKISAVHLINRLH